MATIDTALDVDLEGQPKGLVSRHFTTEGIHPYDTVSWVRRTARITNFKDGAIAFEQEGVEVPEYWSVNATNILAQKYFRGKINSPQREYSLKQVLDRIVDTDTAWGMQHGYFTDEAEAEIFNHECKWLVIHQRMAWNSPVWFNIGAPGRKQQASACFILDVQDDMESLKEWIGTEADIFRGGSGSGANLSLVREDGASLSRGGKASGPVSFMRWADSGAGAIKSAGETRRAAKMVILNADHPDIEDFIWCKALEERKSRVLRDVGYDMDLDGKDTHSVQYQNANNSVRVTDEFMQAVIDDGDWSLISRVDGSVTKTMKARDLFNQIAQAAWECADPGLQYHSTINRWNTTPNLEELDGSNPCSEHIRRRNSSCNLASLNVLAFLNEDGTFNIADFQAAVDITFLSQDILICGADYPTEKIKAITMADRDLGLGVANLGALLMALGLAYDSEEGRTVAAAVVGLTTGGAYRQSARIASRVGPFPSFAGDREGSLKVMTQHREAADSMYAAARLQVVPGITELVAANLDTWREVESQAEAHGLRNAQATVMAPTGTISFLMDCDTTGIEPDLGLKKTKKLVGGGTMAIVNHTVPRALKRLGYSAAEAKSILDYIDQNSSVLGSPHIKPEHLAVFACSMGDNVISPLGHVKMLAALQPMVAGAQSKTVNLPGTATVDDVKGTYIEAWRLGVKCIALYVDASKVAQPLSIDKKESEVDAAIIQLEAEVGDEALKAELEDLRKQVHELTIQVKQPVREKLPNPRQSITMGFSVGGAEGYFTVGKYTDGRPGEIFIKVAKQGGTLAGIFDAFSIQTSMAWQYGVPLKTMVEKFTNMRFEPAGMVGKDDDIKMASSIIDYIFRRLALTFLSAEDCEQYAIKSVKERIEEVESSYGKAATATLAKVAVSSPVASDAPFCDQCGVQMVRAGSCHACPTCGTTSGCS